MYRRPCPEPREVVFERVPASTCRDEKAKREVDSFGQVGAFWASFRAAQKGHVQMRSLMSLFPVRDSRLRQAAPALQADTGPRPNSGPQFWE